MHLGSLGRPLGEQAGLPKDLDRAGLEYSHGTAIGITVGFEAGRSVIGVTEVCSTL